MNNAESMVKIYACKKATSNSKVEINKAIGIDNPDHAMLSFTKIIEIKEITIMWPAVMFANKRINNAAGLIKIPAISIGTKIGYKAKGTPGGINMCFQNGFLENINWMIKVNIANVIVTEIFPVKFGLPIQGISPNKFPIRIKKKTVSR